MKITAALFLKDLAYALLVCSMCHCFSGHITY